MEFKYFASRLDLARSESNEQKIELLTDLLSELGSGERASAVYLLQGRLGLPNQPRSRGKHLHGLSSIWAALSRARSMANEPALPQPSVQEVYQTLHHLIMATEGLELPTDYAWRLRALTRRLDDVSLAWLARILWDRLVKKDATLIKVLVREASRREPGQIGASEARRLRQLYQTTIPYLGYIAELLLQKPFFEVITLGPQHGLLVPREKIQIWKNIEDAWQDMEVAHVFVQGKLDGEHIQIHKRANEVILLAVSGEDVTTELSDVVQLVLDSLPVESAILDAEVVGYDPEAQQILPFYKALRSAHHQVVIFDLLLWRGEDWRSKAYWVRRQKIHTLFPQGPQDRPGIFHVEEVETQTLVEATAAFRAFLDRDCYEGVILKDAIGPCRSGRTSHHRGKLKKYTSLDSVLLGYNTQPESYLVGLWQDEQHTSLVPYRTVESVASKEEHERLRAFCQAHTLDCAPSGVLPGPKPQHWVEPKLVVDVECDGLKRPSSTYVHAGYTLNRGSTIRGIHRGKSIYQANDLSRLRELRDAPGEKRVLRVPQHELPKVEIFTDGACIDNPGPGGWAVVLQYVSEDGEKAERELSGTCSSMTTNNRMELTAVQEGLKALNRPCRVTIYTDSKYIYCGITRWLLGWKRRGWRKASGEQVQNRDLWEELDRLVQCHRVSWRWIRAHNKHPQNERADKLAHAAAQAAARQLKVSEPS